MNILEQFIKRLNAYRQIPPTVTDLYFQIRKYLPSKPIICEAGAHMGYDTVGLSKVWPKGLVYAFEPVPKLFENLSQRVSQRGNVHVINFAIGHVNGEIEMNVSGGSSTASSSLLTPGIHKSFFPSVTFEKKIRVPITRLDSWAEKNNVQMIDLIWLDVQGYEINGLDGVGNLLPKVSVIYTELCKSELYKGQPTREEYILYLQQKGFELISPLINEEVSEGIFINRSAIEARERKVVV